MLICPHCNQGSDNTAVFCGYCGNPLIQRDLPTTRQYANLVTLTQEGEIIVEVHSIEEAKLALKELKMRKKELNIQKKAVNEQMRQIRANYTQYTRNRSMMMRGGGTFGKIVRVGQAISRDAHRRQLAADLAPLEHQKQWYESMTLAIEQAILKIETALKEN